jgi:hypothetical protein
VIERADEGFDDWPATVDPIREAISILLVTIMENTRDGSSERKRAMSEALDAHRRINDAMRDRRVIN